MKKYLIFLIILFTSFVVLFPGINSSAILGQGDESMHISTVRESVKTKQVLIPHLNGSPNYFKPPLLFWMAITSEKVFGQNVWIDRFPAVLMGALSVAVFFLLLQASKVSLRKSLLASAVYLFSLSTFKFSRLLMMEQGLTLAFLTTTYFFVSYLNSKKMNLLLLSGVFAGLGSLFKGPFFLAYTGLLLIVWSNSIFFNSKPIPFFRKVKSSFIMVLTTFFVFHLGASLPILFWTGMYYTYQGDGILKYFFVIENIGKFYFGNQSELKIFFGWFIYTIPWTVLVVYLFYYTIRQKVFLFRHKIGKYLLYTSVLITILHLLPNRKDAYYIVPSVPILLAGITCLFPDRLPLNFLSAMKTNILFNTFLLSLFLVPIFVLQGYDYSFFVIIGAVIVSIAILFQRKAFFANANKTAFITLIHGITILDLFQFVVLPSLNYPIVPEYVKGKIQTKVCIISKEPWDAYSFISYLPNKEIYHQVPGVENGCLDKTRSRIFFRINNTDSNRNEIIEKYSIKWKVWKRDLKLSQILQNPFKKELYFDTAYYQNLTRSAHNDKHNIQKQNN